MAGAATGTKGGAGTLSKARRAIAASFATLIAATMASPGGATAQEPPVLFELSPETDAEVLERPDYRSLPPVSASEAALAAQANNPVGNASFVNLQN